MPFADDERRAVITGMGIVSVAGASLAAFEGSLRGGRSGIGHWRRLGAALESKIGGDLSGFSLQAHAATAGWPSRLTERAIGMLRPRPYSSQATAAASLQAFVDAGLHDAPLAPDRVAAITAGHDLARAYVADAERERHRDPDFVDPLTGLFGFDADTVSVMTELFGLQGMSFTMGGACASGNLAVGAAVDALRLGRADAAIVCGACFEVDALTLQCWAQLGMISVDSFNDDPTRASRPFDARREGFVPSEGAATVVIESLASARRRGARIYAEVRGHGATSSALGAGVSEDAMSQALRLALADARTPADSVRYVNCYASSTQATDLAEANVLRRVFPSPLQLAVNSTKSIVGHCLTSSGIVELVALALQLRGGFVHPTINQDEPDPGIALDVVPNEARDLAFDTAVSNSFGIGGFNTALVVGRL